MLATDTKLRGCLPCHPSAGESEDQPKPAPVWKAPMLAEGRWMHGTALLNGVARRKALEGVLHRLIPISDIVDSILEMYSTPLKLFVAGGHLEGKGAQATAEYYDFTKGSWHSLPPMAEGRASVGLCASPDGRALYAAGGCCARVALPSVERYDIETETWAPMPRMETSRAGLGLVLSPDGKNLYAIGGSTRRDGVRGLSTMECLDLSRGEERKGCWAEMAPMLQRRMYHGACISPDGNFIYVAGGMVDSEVLSSVERYDIEAKTWTELAPMSEARRGVSLCVAPDGKSIYAVGGCCYGNPFGEVVHRHLERYDVELNLWFPVVSILKEERSHLGACIAPDGKTLYAVGGGYDCCRRSGYCSPMSKHYQIYNSVERVTL